MRMFGQLVALVLAGAQRSKDFLSLGFPTAKTLPKRGASSNNIHCRSKYRYMKQSEQQGTSGQRRMLRKQAALEAE